MCDLAETYHIYDYKQLPARQVAVFLCGLRENSRIQMAISDTTIKFQDVLMAGIFDKVNWLCWAQTKDGQKGRNAPESIADKLLAKPEQKDIISFKTGDDFETQKQKILST